MMSCVSLSSLFRAGCVLALVGLAASPAHADFTAYVIRNSGSGNVAPTISADTPSAGITQFQVDLAGQKAALGSNDINGYTLGQIAKLDITRVDDTTRFTAGTGPAVGPYLNFWITDGTHFAVVANEPSDGQWSAFNPGGHNAGGYQLSFADLANKVAKIYETSDKTWLPNNGTGLTFADLANFTIMAPTPAQVVAQPGITSGAPRDLATNEAYGVSWVFGDSAANYVASAPGYQVSNAQVTVPEPASMAILAAGLAGFGLVRRRRA